ncbi:MAG: class I SAM-dependent methyltransferase [Nitrospira sp.]|nr:class I SAM-dependent methyltransferase [Nitrospira sp.]
MSIYRERIYQHYVTARHIPLAPASLSGLSSRAPYLNKVIHEHFPSDRRATVIDLGCGHGALVHFAVTAGYQNVVGVDRSPEQVQEARRLGIPGVREGDLLETLASLSDESVDVLIAFDVIEHFTKDEFVLFVDEVHRVLRKGGKWILHTPNGESPLAGRMRYGDFTHEQAFTRTSLAQILMASGFARVSCYEDAPVPHGFKSAVRFILWKVFRGGFRLLVAAETGVLDEGVFSQNFLAVVVK